MSDQSYKILVQRERAPGWWESTRGRYDLQAAIRMCEDVGFSVARIVLLDDEGDWDEDTFDERTAAVCLNGKMFFLPGTGMPLDDNADTPLPMDVLGN